MRTAPSVLASSLFLSLLCLAALTGCDKKKEAPAARPVRVGLAEVRAGDAPLTVGGVGHVVAQNTVSVQAQVTGVIKSLHFEEGASVTKGQLLAVIDEAPFLAALNQAQGALQRDSAKAAQTRRDYERYKDLLQQKVVSQDEYEQRRTEFETADEQSKADKAAVDAARINLGYCRIFSPLDGVAGYQQVKPGNTVNAYKDTVVTINQVQPILVRFSVNESDLSQVRARFAGGKLPATARPAKSEAGAAEKGFLTAIDNSVDPQTGMITLQAQFDNPGLALWPGQFVQVEVTLAVDAGQTLIPTDALIRRQDGDFVFVAGEGSKAELRPVKAGRSVGDETIILDGLKGGERIVADGLIQVYPGAQLAPKEAAKQEQATGLPEEKAKGPAQ